jgi:hypothetical protein
MDRFYRLSGFLTLAKDAGSRDSDAPPYRPRRIERIVASGPQADAERRFFSADFRRGGLSWGLYSNLLKAT